MERLELLSKWQGDWLTPSHEALDTRIELLSAMEKRERKLAGGLLREARAARDKLAYKYAGPFIHELTLESRVALTWDLHTLLRLAREAFEEMHVVSGQARQWFEAVSLFDQAISLAEIEEHCSIRQVSHELSELVELFLAELCDGVEEADIVSYHDPEDSYRVMQTRFVGSPYDGQVSLNGLHERHHAMAFRRLVDGALAFMDHRPKEAFASWLKQRRQMRQGKHRPFDVADRRGIKFAVMSVEDARGLAEQLQSLLNEHSGDASVDSDNLDTDGVMDPDNEHSSEHYRAIKLTALWKDRRYEIQITTFAHFFSSRLAIAHENHELYRLSQMLDIYLPIIYPREVYAIDWEAEATRVHLLNSQLAMLGWRVAPEQFLQAL